MKNFRNLLFLTALLALALNGYAQKPLIKRTYYDYAGRQLHEEYQYVSTPTNRFSKQGYYKEFNEDGTLWRKHQYRNNKADGRQLEYSTTDGETWLEYDIMVHNALRNGMYIRYSGPNEKMSAGNYVNASREGQWKFYYPEGHEVCTYRDDKKEGPATLFYKNGKVADQYAYRNDEHYDDGDVKGFYEDGSPKKSGHFTDGEMDGKFLAWYPNGQLRYEENYVAGSREGRILAYDQDENVTANDVYSGNILVTHQQTAQELARESQEATFAAQQSRRHHQEDSLQQVIHNQKKADEAAQKMGEQMYSLIINAATRQMFMRNEAAVGQRTRLPRQLYVGLYDKLLADYKTTADGASKLAKAQRIVKILSLAEEVESGHQTALEKAIRKETDLDKVLALTGL